MKPVYVVFAGINGAGKSTFFNEFLWNLSNLGAKRNRVNPDEILKGFGGDSSNIEDQLASGKIAVKKINEYIKNKQSFNQETTLTGRMAVKRLQKAKEAGFKVLVYYICVNSPETAISRIEHRVETGGHNIEPSLVRKRFDESLRNFEKCLDVTDEAYVYDNTTSFKLIAAWRRGSLAWVGDWGLTSPFFRYYRECNE